MRSRVATAKTYVALLRGINVGGRKKVSMADLRALVEAVGAEDVATHLQSGNVILRSREPAAALGPAIEAAIERELGIDVTVVLRTGAQLRKVVGGNPLAGRESDPKKLHVAFLAETPERSRVAKLDPARAEPDVFHVAGREIYLHYPNGYGRSKLTNAWLEQQLGVAATTRNWRTVTRLAELAGR